MEVQEAVIFYALNFIPKQVPMEATEAEEAILF
jgi:hypothetical protein